MDFLGSRAGANLEAPSTQGLQGFDRGGGFNEPQRAFGPIRRNNRGIAVEPRWERDYYPTIDLSVRKTGWKEEALQRGLRITSDFDAGNPDVAAFSNEGASLVQPTAGRVVRRALHLGKHYDYSLATLKVGVEDVKGAGRCGLKARRAVLSWSDPGRNPYLLANPARGLRWWGPNAYLPVQHLAFGKE